MPALHNPTNATMNADRRERLATIARRAGVPSSKDDPYGPLARGERTASSRWRPITSCTSRRSRRRSRRVCASAWLIAPRDDPRTPAAAQTSLRHGNEPLRASRGRRLSERGYDAHVEQLREELLRAPRARRRRNRAALAGRIEVSRPSGGFYLWASTPRELRARALLDAAERLGASFLFGEAFFASSGGDHNFRLALPPSRDARSPRESVASAQAIAHASVVTPLHSGSCAGTRATAARRCPGARCAPRIARS